MPKLATTTVIANGVLMNGEIHLSNGDVWVAVTVQKCTRGAVTIQKYAISDYSIGV